METIDINTLMPYVTTLAAIITPVLTAYITAKSSERTKKIEFQQPRAFNALNDFIEAYANLNAETGTYNYVGDSSGFGTDVSYKSFVAAAHKLIPLIPDPSLQLEICDLLKTVLTSGRRATPATDKAIDNLAIKLGTCLVRSKRSANISKKRKITKGNDD